jgi:ribosomal protein L11 methyltransferase
VPDQRQTPGTFYSRLQVICNAEFTEILMAEVADAGFDTFMETEKGFEAYAEGDRFDKERLKQIKEQYGQQTGLIFFHDRVQKQNWNEEWEKNYEPIIVENKCLIRASFHKPDKSIPYEIIITPKMSFGTGHHQTTYLMVKAQMEIDHSGKKVMDAGCGTAILSIMASKLGAREVHGFDIDEWSMINGKENVEVNGCNNVQLQQGTIAEVKLSPPFDIILANINKNVLLAEISTYHKFLAAQGLLLLSGFYTHDIDDLLNEAKQFGLTELRRYERETWASVLLQKAS